MQYRAGAKSIEVIPVHHIWYFEQTKMFMLSEWGSSAEETAIAEIEMVLGKGLLEEVGDLRGEALQKAVASVIMTHGVPAILTKMELTAKARADIAALNSTRTKQKKFSTAAIDDGFFGAKFEYIHGVTPVMDIKTTKFLLAAIMLLNTPPKTTKT